MMNWTHWFDNICTLIMIIESNILFVLICFIEYKTQLVTRYKVVCNQDNARPYVSVRTLQKLNDFDWTVFNYRTYSPDIAPLDCIYFGCWNTQFVEGIESIWAILKIPSSSCSHRSQLSCAEYTLKLTWKMEEGSKTLWTCCDWLKICH